ncbi:hypothetical protein [Intrasporangium sp. DVR]|uniref:hypothetical protein n=1 Tax=Intrasporangium sp. DVR TaxID=3127867 RepID=UPI00313A598E
MVEPGTGAVRALRALVFLAIATALSLAGHVLGGGSASLVGVGALVVLTWPLALLGSRRQRGVRHLFPVLVAGQLAGHVVLAYLGSALTNTSPAAGCTTVHAHHGPPLLDCGQAAAATSGHGATPTMTVAHLGAALVLAVVLARGEALLWRVVDLAVPVLPRLRPLVIRPLRAAFVVHRGLRGIDVAVVPGRGPPVAA